MKRYLLMTILSVMVFYDTSSATSLKEMYDLAPSANGYDRYIELETGVVYTGGLLIGKAYNRVLVEFEGNEGEDVKILGNGAILDLQGEQICIAYCENVLDIEDCIIINGNVRYQGINDDHLHAQPIGSVQYVTFYEPHDYGIRLTGSGDGITLERNIIVDAVCTGDDFIYLSGYSNSWLPTGLNFAASGQFGYYGYPEIIDNWSYHSDPVNNEDLLNHFGYLCEYG